MRGKKTKYKKKLNPGGLLNQQQTPSDQAIDTIATTALAGAGLGPLAAPVVQGSNMLNQALTGDGTNKFRNIAAQSISPINNLKALAQGNFKEAIPIIGGINKAKRMKGEMAEAKLEEQRDKNLSLAGQKRANMQFKHGGKLLSNKLDVQDGGYLSPVSEDAVEVKADNPTQTDSVEIQDAFVDNNEIIDNKDRVFSDSILAPSGRTIAKEAKRLEKMKGPDRFKDANSLIDKKLDALFSYQEATKPKESTTKMQMGGELNDPIVFGKALKGNNDTSNQLYKNYMDYNNPDFLQLPEGDPLSYLAKQKTSFKTQELKDLDKSFIGPKQQMRDKVLSDNLNTLGVNDVKQAISMKRKEKLGLSKGGKKPGYAMGTPNLSANDFLRDLKKNQQDLDFYNKYTTGIGPDSTVPFVDTSDVVMPTETMPTSKKGLNITGDQVSTGISAAATVLPNIVNARLQKKLKGPAKPLQEGRVRFDRVDPTAELQSIDRDFGVANQAIKKSSAQASNVAAASGSMLAKKLAAKNQTFNQANQSNVQIGNQEKGVNLGITARNLGKLDQFNQNKNDFANRKLQMTSENVANLSGKIQAAGRERNMMQLDKDKAVLQSAQFGDSGVLSRLGEKLASSDPETYTRLKKQGYFKFGGKLKKLDKKKMK